MKKIKMSLDQNQYKSKPKDNEIPKICSSIARNIVQLNSENIKSFAKIVGECGQTWCPATFYNGKCNGDNFEQMNMFVLDFDNDKSNKIISWQQVKERADKYNLPILFAYETMSSGINNNGHRFRVVFLNDISIPHKKAAETIIAALRIIFPESDELCTNVARMFFGGKKLFYFDDNLPAINIELLFRNMSFYLKNKYGNTHYKSKIYKFAENTGLKLNKNNMLDIYVGENRAESIDGNISPTTIILPIADGELLPTVYYALNFEDKSTKNNSANKTPANHALCRSSDINIVRDRCRLFSDFESGKRWLHHNELYGIAVSLNHIETGKKVFLNILKANSNITSYADKYNQWDYYLDYFKKNDYKPQNCNSFCPYKYECQHGINILSTIKVKNHEITELANSVQKFYPIEEVCQDVRDKIAMAIHSVDTDIYVIKAQTAIGKTEAYLDFMEEAATPFMIAVPTNILKHDVYRRALEKGIKVMETPSLHELLAHGNIPLGVKRHIDNLYNTGNNKAVVPYIKKIAAEYDIFCLKEYLEDLDKIRKFDGHIITTHRRLLNSDEDELSKYTVIVDEDIIYKGVAANQETITISQLKKIRRSLSPHSALSEKIRQILEYTKTDELFTVPEIEFDEKDDNDDTSWDFDVSSLCEAGSFCFLKKSEQNNIQQDCITYLKPVEFRNVKYIIVSATANETIYNYYFGVDRVKFYECKKARYQGILNQYYDRTMSRADIKTHPDTFKKIKDRLGTLYTITFNEFKKIIYQLQLHLDEADLHFGATEGCDFLAGQRINIIGTPHYPPHLYKLFAYTIGLSFDMTAEMKPNQTICRNGYQFKFTTFTDEILKSIQIFFIESELEQAVGRARLLRRAEAQVNLFSNFPISQANLKLFNWNDN